MDSNPIDLLGNHQSSKPPAAEPVKDLSSEGKGSGWMGKIKQWLGGSGSKPPAKKVVAMRSLTVGPRPEPSGFDVNLIPEIETQKTTRQRVQILGSAVLVTVGLLLVVEFFLLAQRSNVQGNLSDLQTQLQMVEQAITELEPIQAEATKLRDRVDRAGAIADHHVYWTQLLEEIEASTLPTVTYSSLVADQAGTLTMAATAKSFEDVGEQLGVFKAKQGISDVQVGGVTAKGKGEAGEAENDEGSPSEEVDFSLSLKFDPSFLFAAPLIQSSQSNVEE